MNENNPVTPDDNPYTIRLKKLTEGLTEADGIPLNFKVYDVIDVNAFACPDGSVIKVLTVLFQRQAMLAARGGYLRPHPTKNVNAGAVCFRGNFAS